MTISMTLSTIDVSPVIASDATSPAPGEIACSNCQACCCRLEVILLTDTGVPDYLIDEDEWGGEVMRRLDDGWCAAVDRETLMCTIYDRRPMLCREYEMGSPECEDERLENGLDQ
ncbi:YkgJ family cysteine cluster protein [Cobetia sp. L2A1]|uniref:YkgJ family cysteine cluster protein n=1 Tax=Cobetia sp. L2A1 TaxID=2686360 RepID=UPI00131CCF09|nr:YkgJ family cysteine cluster protein [Cobetia sp. L2A1]